MASKGAIGVLPPATVPARAERGAIELIALVVVAPIVHQPPLLHATHHVHVDGVQAGWGREWVEPRKNLSLIPQLSAWRALLARDRVLTRL